MTLRETIGDLEEKLKHHNLHATVKKREELNDDQKLSKAKSKVMKYKSIVTNLELELERVKN